MSGRTSHRLNDVYDRHGEKLRFLIVGVWNTLFGVGAVWVLDRLIPYDPASVLEKQLVLVAAWVISVTHNFFTFKLLVFRTKGRWLREYARMYVTYSATFIVQSVLVQAISYAFGLSVFWANLPTIAVVTVMSYLGHKHFTFREPASVFEESEATAEGR
ncbi:MAG: GtrA family protein [Coriobacteriia bacterium]|nr:GtrA family protein [Coriobacteriia bacterium]